MSVVCVYKCAKFPNSVTLNRTLIIKSCSPTNYAACRITNVCPGIPRDQQREAITSKTAWYCLVYCLEYIGKRSTKFQYNEKVSTGKRLYICMSYNFFFSNLNYNQAGTQRYLTKL